MFKKLLSKLLNRSQRIKNKKFGFFISKSTELCAGYNDNRNAYHDLRATFKANFSDLTDKTLPYSLIANLIKIAKENNNNLSILDFGGAAGITYFLSRSFLSGINLTWNIVEVESYAKIVDNHFLFKETPINYYDSINKLSNQIDVIIASGVLQYIENPINILEQFFNLNAKYLILDRTQFLMRDIPSIMTIQKVDKGSFYAFLPCLLLNKKEIYDKLSSKYQFINEFRSLVDIGNTNIRKNKKIKTEFLGSIWKLK